MGTLHAFRLGMTEYRSAFTTNFDDERLQRVYDQGRDLAHKMTLRRYED